MGREMGTRENEMNYDDENLADVSVAIEQEQSEGLFINRAFTMVQTNTNCEVSVSENSRRICVDAIFS